MTGAELEFEEDQDLTETMSQKGLSKKDRIIKIALGALAILVCIGFVIGILVAIITYYTDTETTTIESTSTKVFLTTQETTRNSPTTLPMPPTSAESSIPPPPSSQDIFTFVPEANYDGINIQFFHGANSEEDLNLALKDTGTDMMEGDVNLKYYGTPSQSEEAVMNNPLDQIADLTLDAWLDFAISSDKAIKLDAKVDEVVSIILTSLRQRKNTIHQPVWINGEVVEGPDSGKAPLNAEDFFNLVDSIFPEVTVSLGWTTSSRIQQGDIFSWESMDQMLTVMKKFPQRTTVLVRALLMRNSWEKILWLLEQSDDYSLTVYDQGIDDVSSEDLLFARDNLAYSRVFYDVSNTTKQKLWNALETERNVMFFSGGNVLEYFRIPGRQAINVTWAHRVVGKEELNNTLHDDSILMIETDVRLDGEGTGEVNESLPVMAHDLPVSDYELTLDEWLAEVVSSNQTKGVKLDFKSIGALEASLSILKKKKADINFPLWINADVFSGPNAGFLTPVNATMFFNLVVENFPECTFSPGWKTVYRFGVENEIYTQDMVEEANQMCSSLRQAVTFPVRASLARPSIPQFQWLLSQSNRYTLTIWYSTSETVPIDDLLEVYNSFSPSKVYFDLPDDTMQQLLEAIKNQTQ